METLDQDVVNLAKAIRQVETGNSPKAGATGELKSRYQFMPATWASSAAKFLGDAKAPLTLENENQVAYRQIKEWKDKGYRPDQIASLWNSGKPDSHLNKVRGVSSTNPNVKYDVPAYVEKVRKAYVGLKQSEGIAHPQTVEPTAEEPKRSAQVGGNGVAGNALNALAGFGKGVISTLTGLSSLGQRGAAAIGIPLAKGINVNGQTIGGFRGGQSSAQQLIPEEYRKPEGLPQKIGFGTEQVAEFLVPGGVGTKVGAAASKLPVLASAPKVAQKFVPLAARGAAEAGLAAGQVSAQRGTTEGSGTAAAIGGLIPFGGALASKLGSAARKVPQTAWNAILKRTPTEAAKSPNLPSLAVKTGLVGGARSLLKQAEENIQSIEVSLDEILKPAKGRVNANSVASYLDDLKESYGRIPGEESSVAVIDSIAADIRRRKSMTPAQANRLKQDIYALIKRSYGKGTMEVPAKQEAQKAVAAGLKREIERVVPEAKSLTERQAVYIQIRNAIEKRLARQEGKGIAGTGVGIYDLMLGGIGTAYGASTGSPLAGIAAVAGKKLLEAPATLSRIAKSTDALARYFDSLSPTKKALFYDAIRGLTIGLPSSLRGEEGTPGQR